MKKKKLVLNKEIVSNLDDNQMNAVKGGIFNTKLWCKPATDTCPPPTGDVTCACPAETTRCPTQPATYCIGDPACASPKPSVINGGQSCVGC